MYSCLCDLNIMLIQYILKGRNCLQVAINIRILDRNTIKLLLDRITKLGDEFAAKLLSAKDNYVCFCFYCYVQ